MRKLTVNQTIALLMVFNNQGQNPLIACNAEDLKVLEIIGFINKTKDQEGYLLTEVGTGVCVDIIAITKY